jgi:hypothetical protein
MNLLQEFDLSATVLIERAIEQVGLEDFGHPGLSPEFFNMVDEINTSAQLTPLGRSAREHHLIHLLCNRLKIEEYSKLNPAVHDVPIRSPIIIVGLPRSGTTKLHRLLAKDPQFNFLALWQCFSPVPLSEHQDDLNARIGYADDFCREIAARSPDFFAAHPIYASEPDECHTLMQHSFMTEAVEAEMRLPDYIMRLSDANHRPMYEQHAHLIRTIAHAHSMPDAPWLLKGVYHGASLDILLSLHPNATVVYCHRDPVQTISSYASLVCNLRALLSDAVVPEQVGPEILHHLSTHLDRTMKVRDKIPTQQIVDVPYSEIVSDIWGVVEKIYGAAGLHLSLEGRLSMEQWDSCNPQHVLGVHKYDMRQYGLTAEMISNSCQSYREAFIL